jgi:hypothetical protein
VLHYHCKTPAKGFGCSSARLDNIFDKVNLFTDKLRTKWLCSYNITKRAHWAVRAG